MRQFIATLALLLTIALSGGAAQAVPPLPKPQVIAVYFWAATCPNCKLLSPMLDEARQTANLDSKPVLFVTLDLTSPQTIHQSVMLASALGIAPYVQSQGSATGYVALLSATSKKELARLDRTSNPAAIAQTIEDALAKAAK